MLEFEFDRASRTPLVSALICGPKGRRRLTLVFDTGAVITQIHAPTLAIIGYTEENKTQSACMVGASGERQDGFLVQSERLVTLGSRIENAIIGGFDFGDLSRAGIDGLLGWDVIKQLHLELDGPAGLLKVF
jgi:hypothetical protein